MEDIYTLTIQGISKEAFINSILSVYNIQIVSEYKTIPNFLSVKMDSEQKVKLLESPYIKRCEPCNVEVSTGIVYEGVKIFEESDLPNVGINAATYYNKFETRDTYYNFPPLSSSFKLHSVDIDMIGFGSRSGDYDHTHDISQSIRFCTNSDKALPKSWATWRITVPNTQDSASDAVVIATSASNLVFEENAESYFPPTSDLSSDSDGVIIEEPPVIGTPGVIDTHIIQLNSGFNLISTYIDTRGTRLYDIITGSLYNTVTDAYAQPSLVTSSDSPIDIIKNNEGAQINFQQSSTYDGIGLWNPEEGYQIKMNTGIYELRVSGSVLKQYDYELGPGWHIMSFPSTIELPLADVFLGDALNTNIYQIKNNEGQIYSSPLATGTGTAFDGITKMIPGQGYQINIRNGSVIVDISNDVSVPGCTILGAANYNPDATVNDGSCIIYGCTVPLSKNFNPNATHNDNTCDGATRVHTIRIGPDANYIGTYIDLNTLPFSTYNNWGELFDANLYNVSNPLDRTPNTLIGSSAIQLIKDQKGKFWSETFDQGLEISNRVGYQVQTADDTSVYFLHLEGQFIDLTSNVLQYTYEGSGADQTGLLPVLSTTPVNIEEWITFNESFDSNFRTKLSLLRDSSGAFWTDDFSQIAELDPGRAYEIRFTADITIRFEVPIVYGCTDPVSSNYNPLATHNDGSCTFAPSPISSQVIKLPPTALVSSVNTFNISTYLDIDTDLARLISDNIFLEGDGEQSSITGGDNPLGVSYAINEIKDQTNGKSWVAEYGADTSNIGNIVPGAGYLISLDNVRDKTKRYELRLPGNALTSFTYNLTSGWNYIGVPFTEPRPAEEVFASIVDHIIILKNNLGKGWSPIEGYNQIGDLIPGEGYLLKVTNDLTVSVDI